jgi:hypothetical protein
MDPIVETTVDYESFTNFPGTEGSISTLCELMNGLWFLGYIILFVSVLVAFAFAGFLYTSAGVNAASVARAKEIFIGGVIALVIGFSLVLVLQVINPDLLSSQCEIEPVVRVGRSTFEFRTGEGIGGDAQPAGPYGGPVIAPDGTFASGLFTGPEGSIGSGSEYHIDIRFPEGTSWETIDQYYVAMAQGYAANGRVIEFSNSRVGGLRFDPNAPQSERIALLQRVAAAHASRPGWYAMDYYAPITSETRFGRSVEGHEMILPAPAGGRAEYNTQPGGAGHYVDVYDSNGTLIYRNMHGDMRRSLPSGRTF